MTAWPCSCNEFSGTIQENIPGATMQGVYANRNASNDFILNELERRSASGCDVYIASAFFTDLEVVERLLAKGCKVLMVVRLGFPTNPDAIEKAMRNLNLQLRVYTGHSYHPKLYIFGDEVALVGSANLTRSALLTNQEVVVSIDSSDDRFIELMAIFEDYWDGAEVPTTTQLAAYRDLFKQFSKLENEVDLLAQKVLDKIGDKSPNNINRGKPKENKQSLFLSNYRRTYQECVSAFDVVRRTYAASGFRKTSDPDIPLRIEIDSFISYVREKVAVGESWLSGPIRSPQEQETLIKGLIADWRLISWPHFENTIVGTNYPRFRRVFGSRAAIMAADDSDLFDALSTLHSFYDRFRFFDGGLATWKRDFPTFNDPTRTRETLAYLVYGDGDIVQRMANAIFDPKYKLNAFGQANVQELVGWCNREDLPIINGRTTKVLRYFGSKVRQL
jgi:HKD family nuclease